MESLWHLVLVSDDLLLTFFVSFNTIFHGKKASIEKHKIPQILTIRKLKEKKIIALVKYGELLKCQHQHWNSEKKTIADVKLVFNKVRNITVTGHTMKNLFYKRERG